MEYKNLGMKKIFWRRSIKIGGVNGKGETLVTMIRNHQGQEALPENLSILIHQIIKNHLRVALDHMREELAVSIIIIFFKSNVSMTMMKSLAVTLRI